MGLTWNKLIYCPFLGSLSIEGAGSHGGRSPRGDVVGSSWLGTDCPCSGKLYGFMAPFASCIASTTCSYHPTTKNVIALVCKGPLLFLGCCLQEQLGELRKTESMWKNKTGSLVEKCCDSWLEGCGSRSIFLAKGNNSNLNTKRSVSWWDTKVWG